MEPTPEGAASQAPGAVGRTADLPTDDAVARLLSGYSGAWRVITAHAGYVPQWLEDETVCVCAFCYAESPNFRDFRHKAECSVLEAWKLARAHRAKVYAKGAHITVLSQVPVTIEGHGLSYVAQQSGVVKGTRPGAVFVAFDTLHMHDGNGWQAVEAWVPVADVELFVSLADASRENES